MPIFDNASIIALITWIDTSALAQAAEAQRQRAATVIFVGVGGRLAGFVAIADPIKATTAQALQALKAADVRIVMLTGDGMTTAQAVGRQLGITRERVRQIEAGALAKLRHPKVLERLRS